MGSKPPAKHKRVQKTKNSSGGEMDSNTMEVVSSSREEYTGESAAVEEPLRVQLRP
jgi:hypothetical protein